MEPRDEAEASEAAAAMEHEELAWVEARLAELEGAVCEWASARRASGAETGAWTHEVCARLADARRAARAHLHAMREERERSA